MLNTLLKVTQTVSNTIRIQTQAIWLQNPSLNHHSLLLLIKYTSNLCFHSHVKIHSTPIPQTIYLVGTTSPANEQTSLYHLAIEKSGLVGIFLFVFL